MIEQEIEERGLKIVYERKRERGEVSNNRDALSQYRRNCHGDAEGLSMKAETLSRTHER